MLDLFSNLKQEGGFWVSKEFKNNTDGELILQLEFSGTNNTVIIESTLDHDKAFAPVKKFKCGTRAILNLSDLLEAGMISRFKTDYKPTSAVVEGESAGKKYEMAKFLMTFDGNTESISCTYGTTELPCGKKLTEEEIEELTEIILYAPLVPDNADSVRLKGEICTEDFTIPNEQFGLCDIKGNLIIDAETLCEEIGSTVPQELVGKKCIFSGMEPGWNYIEELEFVEFPVVTMDANGITYTNISENFKNLNYGEPFYTIINNLNCIGVKISKSAFMDGLGIDDSTFESALSALEMSASTVDTFVMVTIKDSEIKGYLFGNDNILIVYI